MSQRVIKFRAWDGKRMLYTAMSVIPEHLQNYSREYFTPIVVLHNRVETWFLESKISDKHFDHPTYLPYKAMMQFTGGVDQNGKEIYENDVWVKYSKEIKGKELAKLVVTIDPYVATFDGWNPKQGVVIGNIYENPDLTPQS